MSMKLPGLQRKPCPLTPVLASLICALTFAGAASAASGGITTTPPRGELTLGVAAYAPAPGPLLDEAIPVAVFWREIFPAMVLVLAFAVVLSLAYVQLRREVGRRRAAELRLEAARDLADSASLAKASFFATMSHEIRTPLSGIIGMLDLLRRGTMDEEQRQMLTAVDTAANALLQILDDVLDFSKAEANRMSLESVPVDLRAIVHSVVMVIGEPARRRGVRTSLRVNANVSGEVLGDPLRIRQILSNLMSNAAKFTHQGQVTLTVSVDRSSASEQWVRFTVSDTGIGIPRDKLAHVMAPYRQADGATSRHYGGTGLGLSVCSRLAVLMGGAIELDSLPGRGTTATFTCRFVVTAGPPEPAASLELDVDSLSSRGDAPARRSPVAARTAADVRAPGDSGGELGNGDGDGVGRAWVGGALPAGASPGSGGPILVVDDHAINREVVRRQLMTLGYSCEVREDAPSALEALRQGSYALLLTDCQMPPMNGGELARAWREIEAARGAGPRMPIVAMTATAERAMPAPAICDAIDACLYKPIKLDSLREMLMEWLPGTASTSEGAALGALAPAIPGVPDHGEVPMIAAGPLAPMRGLDLDSLQSQFGDALTARRFALQSVQMLHDDLAQARGPLCEQFYDQAARWLHRSVGALSMLGHWPVLTTCAQLEKAMEQAAAEPANAKDCAQLLPRLAAVLREFEDTLGEIERELDGGRGQSL
ncbi:ATP-binding protein [Achromobacter aloeverae]